MLASYYQEHILGIFIYTGIIFTIVGVAVLDLCCDACQTPSRTLMVDLTTIKDQTRGLTMFTVVAGAGGAIGYTIAGEILR